MESVSFSVFYDGGIMRDRDDALDMLAIQFKGRKMGSGQLLLPPYTRDKEWTFPSATLSRAFAVKVHGRFPWARFTFKQGDR